MEVLGLVLKFFEDGSYEPVFHKVTVDKPTLTTAVRLDEADPSLSVEESIPLGPAVSLYIESHLWDRPLPLQAATGAFLGVDVVELLGQGRAECFLLFGLLGLLRFFFIITTFPRGIRS